MDRKSQAKVLRDKQFGNKAKINPPVIQNGVVKFSKPVERKVDPIKLLPPTVAQLRKLRAEKIAEQRKQMIEERNKKMGITQTFQLMNASTADKKKTKKGCSTCRRKGK